MKQHITHRYSSLQKDILFLLFHYSIRTQNPLPFTALTRMLNKGRNQDIYITNLRTSCRVLIERGLLLKFREANTIKVAYSLSQEGFAVAQDISQSRLGDPLIKS